MQEIKVRFSAALFLIAALLLLVIPLRWIFAAIGSIALHELCHILSARLFHRRIYGIQIRDGGIALHTETMTDLQELICALAGPASFFIGLFLSRWFPRLAVCSAFHTAYNLLPVYPLDGGRALACLVRLFLPECTARKVCRAAEHICLCAIVFAGYYGTFRLGLGSFPVILSWFILWRAMFRKIPCKQTQLRVQ